MNNLQQLEATTNNFIVAQNNYDEVIKTYENSGFLYASKLAKIAKHGFTFFEKKSLENFVSESLSSLPLSWRHDYRIETGGDRFVLRQKYSHLCEVEIIADESKVYGSVSLEDYNLMTNNKIEMFRREPNCIHRQTKLADGEGSEVILYDVQITEDNIKDYPGVPPLFIAEKAQRAIEANVFDELTVLDVKKQEYVLQEVIEDPLLVGKISQRPDLYFLIAGWDSNIKDLEILNQKLCSKEAQSLLK